MTEQPVAPSPEVTSDDKLWAALAYVLTPVVPIVLLLLEDKKNRPFIKAHNVQALVWGIIFYIIVVALSPILVGLCLWPIGVLLEIYWAYKAYQGQYVEIPVITNFVKGQGWA